MCVCLWVGSFAKCVFPVRSRVHVESKGPRRLKSNVASVVSLSAGNLGLAGVASGRPWSIWSTTYFVYIFLDWLFFDCSFSLYAIVFIVFLISWWSWVVCSECHTHQSVSAQVFCAIRRRLRFFLDGRRCWVCQAKASFAWKTTEIWPYSITHSTPHFCTVSTDYVFQALRPRITKGHGCNSPPLGETTIQLTNNYNNFISRFSRGVLATFCFLQAQSLIIYFVASDCRLAITGLFSLCAGIL